MAKKDKDFEKISLKIKEDFDNLRKSIRPKIIQAELKIQRQLNEYRREN